VPPTGGAHVNRATFMVMVMVMGGVVPVEPHAQAVSCAEGAAKGEIRPA